MIKYVHYSDLLDCTSGCIVHGMNCQGVMGAGFAKDLRAKYPKVYDDYLAHLDNCLRNHVDPLGTVVYTKISPRLVVAAALIQRFYGRSTSVMYCHYPAVYQSFRTIAHDVVAAAKHYQDPGLAVLHFPRIGCGLANGQWPQVEQEIVSATAGLIPAHDLHLHLKPELTLPSMSEQQAA